MKSIFLSSTLAILFLLGIIITVIGVFWWTPAFYVGVVFLAIGSLFEFIEFIK